jgi:hypothetical protein
MGRFLLMALLVFSGLTQALELGVDIGGGTIIIGEDGVRIEPGHGRPGYGHGPAERNVMCKAFDYGWEEHFGGHNSCGECKRAHRTCERRCSAEMYVAVAEGVHRRRGGGRAIERVRGAPSYDRWRAQDSALDECEYSGLRRCRIVDVRSQWEEISRRDCDDVRRRP